MDFFAISSLEISLGLVEAMERSMFSKVVESFSHFCTNDISPVTEVLEDLYPDNSCLLDRPDEHIQPDTLSSFEHSEW